MTRLPESACPCWIQFVPEMLLEKCGSNQSKAFGIEFETAHLQAAVCG